MPNLILRGAWLAHVVIQNNEAGCFCRLNVRADFTESVRQEMGWDELGLRSKMMDLEGELPFGRLALQAQQITISGQGSELRLEFDDAAGFRAVRVKDKDQESSRVELRFHVRTTNDNAAALCQEYKRSVKKGLGELKIVYSDSGRLDETEAVATLANSDDRQLSIVEGMKVGARGKKKHTRAMETAAAEVTVQVDPDERERLEQVIEQSLH